MALIGIDRDRVFSIGWGIGAAAVGIAGVMLATFYYISPTVGDNFALIAYVTVALGGFGSLLGALIAGLLVGVVEALTALRHRSVAEADRHFRDLRSGPDVPAARPIGAAVSAVMGDNALIRRRRRELIVGAVAAGGARGAAAADQQRVSARADRADLALCGTVAGMEYSRRLLRANLARPCAVFRRRRLYFDHAVREFRHSADARHVRGRCACRPGGVARRLAVLPAQRALLRHRHAGGQPDVPAAGLKLEFCERLDGHHHSVPHAKLA